MRASDIYPPLPSQTPFQTPTTRSIPPHLEPKTSNKTKWYKTFSSYRGHQLKEGTPNPS